jgi:tetratricopeptide (TPR) repeat protein
MLSAITRKEWKYLHSLIDKSEFRAGLSFISKVKLPSAEQASFDHLYFMEGFIRLLISQGFQPKALPVIIKLEQRLNTLKEKDNFLSAKLKIYHAQCLVDTGQQSLVLSLYQDAYQLLENEPEYQSEFGWIYLGYSQIDKLINNWELYLENALECFHRAKDSVGEAAALNSFGIYFGKLFDRELAEEYLEMALAMSQKCNDLRRLAGCMNNLAVLYYFNSTAEHEVVGEQLLGQAIEISKKIESWEFLAQHYKAMISYFQSKQLSRRAIPYIENLYQIQEKRGVLLSEQRELYQSLILNQKELLKSITTQV